MELHLHLADLVPGFLIRTRGSEAADALRQRIGEHEIRRAILDMQADSPVGQGFIDEMVVQAARIEAEGGPEIVFVVRDADMLRRFQNTVNWRDLTCRVRLADETEIRTLEPDGTEPDRPPVRFETKAEIFGGAADASVS
ncbi:MAG: hypothetical protein COY42_22900 [Armatimonadetes bacterium CG_4_10_14_0_8_um_filter_66_14]|nr:MAG: hypothetical protein COY42_22900 [Armatimonadetes bacterium CG_4_10_14_0_8_um_filter_66_14]PJB63447.1 MAG: hypothetical protein CO096_22290 [Armatimonadetes bacterium CG_4_9_14_3_um_filter_66_14]